MTESAVDDFNFVAVLGSDLRLADADWFLLIFLFNVVECSVELEPSDKSVVIVSSAARSLKLQVGLTGIEACVGFGLSGVTEQCGFLQKNWLRVVWNLDGTGCF